MKERITLEDNTMSAIMKMAEGNPGAAMAMMDILREHERVDPQAMLGGIGAIMMLDTWGIYGSQIYVLFADKCDKNVRDLLMLMRAVQLGFLPVSKLKAMAGDQTRTVNLSREEWDELDQLVCSELEEFAKAAA